MNQKPNRRSAIVVGAGIGGLSTAVGLHRLGWEVTVLERSDTLREMGAGMSLMANARRCLDQLGVGDALRECAATMLPGGEGMRTPNGRRLVGTVDADFVARNDLVAAVVLRPQLQRIFADALPAGCVKTDTEVTNVVTDAGDGQAAVVCRTPAGFQSVEADLVVGADGLNSTIRAALWPDTPKPVYSGHSAWQGVTATSFIEPGGNTWGRGLQFGRTPLAEGRVWWYAVANTPAFQRHADEKEEVLRRFSSWHQPIPSLIEATPDGTVLHHDCFELAKPLPSYISGSVAVLGDAAHAMTYDIGQGACQALEDAVVLCVAIATEPDVRTALNTYDRLRRPRSQTIAEISRQVGQTTMMQQRLSVLLRNLTMWCVPRAAIRRRLIEIGGWSPPTLAPAAEQPVAEPGARRPRSRS
jgi:2-polyprenyl-6-methoxyphenol hydroxylase-like FAD-dependent oxidoreductase